MVNENDKKMSDYSENSMDELNSLLDDFILNGRVEKTKLVVPGFNVKLKALDTGELLIAEALMDNSSAPKDIVARVRAASILSQAIIEINDVKIDIEGAGYSVNKAKRLKLYRQLLKMPAMVVQKTYEFYLECVETQNGKYSDPTELIEDVKNFSEPHLEK